jgi:hypothetical protein
MISTPDRRRIITLINEAVAAGARLLKACDVLNLSMRTIQRWRLSDGNVREDARPTAWRPTPRNKLTEMSINGAEIRKYRIQNLLLEIRHLRKTSLDAVQGGHLGEAQRLHTFVSQIGAGLPPHVCAAISAFGWRRDCNKRLNIDRKQK